MQCPNCQFENVEGMNFCGKCGSKLEQLCPQCKFSNPPEPNAFSNTHRPWGRVGMVTMIALFSVIEVARAFFVLNALDEATRRGARVAAVCPVNDPAIGEITVFNTSGGGAASPLLPGLSTGNVAVEYLDGGGATVADPNGNYADIAYVRVRIVNFQHTLIIPMFLRTFTTPDFAATLPRGSRMRQSTSTQLFDRGKKRSTTAVSSGRSG